MVGLAFGSGSLTTNNLQKFIKSLKDNKDLSFDLLEIKNCPVFPEFSYHRCHFKRDNVDLIGTGEDFNDEISQWKAIGEVLERWPLVDKSLEWSALSLSPQKRENLKFKSSNGSAFHFDKELALLGARKEIYERHIILNAWLEGVGVYEVTFNLMGKIQQFLNGKKNEVETRCLYFENDLNLPIFCTEIWGKDFRFYGYGADLDKEKALFKSYYEAWRFYWDYQSGKKRQFTQGEDPCLEHYYHYLNHHALEAFPVEGSLAFKSLLSLKEFHYHGGEAYLCDLNQVGIHGYVYKIIDNELIDLWVGPLNEDQGIRKAGDFHPIA